MLSNDGSVNLNGNKGQLPWKTMTEPLEAEVTPFIGRPLQRSGLELWAYNEENYNII